MYGFIPSFPTKGHPENGWLEYDGIRLFPFGMAYFQGLLLLVSGSVPVGESGVFLMGSIRSIEMLLRFQGQR